MKHVYTRLLDDAELRSHLERGDTVAFENLARDWEKIERQVERLGYGDTYAVSRTSKPSAPGQIRLSPVHPPGKEA
jgi:hypothetical protein